MTTDALPALAGLTVKQAAFLDAYLACGNASEAYRQVYDVAGMLSVTVGREATRLLAHHTMATLIAERRVTAAQAVDAAILAARVGAPRSLGRLEAIADLDPTDDPRQLPSIKGANETLLSIAEVIPKAGIQVDARSLTVNVGGRDARLARWSDDELLALLDRMPDALPAHEEAVDEPDAPSS